MRKLTACLPIISLLVGLMILPSPAAPELAFRLFSPAQLVDAAAIHSGKFDSHAARTLRYFTFHALPPAQRAKAIKAFGYVLNSLSRNDLIFLPAEVPGTEQALVYFDVTNLRDRDDARGLKQLLDALDQLGEKGSGPAPAPEPYFHAAISETYDDVVTEDVQYGYWVDSYGALHSAPAEGRTWRYAETRRVEKTVKKVRKKVALSPALNRAAVIGLTAQTATNFPIFDARWFAVNALVEPAYHLLLNLDDSEASVLKLADADEKTADRLGAQLRGAVLFSEVAHRNRLLERTPTRLKHGRGSFHRSFDFKTSIDTEDVLKDTLTSKADAHEIIFTLPNGLSGYFVSDAKGKRLDKADADIAIYRRGRWQDPQVRTSFLCMDCHIRDKGFIEVDDEVAEFAKKTITLAVAVKDRDGDRGRRVRQKYLTASYNELLQHDQVVLDAAVRAATGGKTAGLTSAETAKVVMDVIRDYIEKPVVAEQLALELGVPTWRLLRLAEVSGVDHTLVGLRTGRKQRRDQVEAAFSQYATLLYLGK